MSSALKSQKRGKKKNKKEEEDRRDWMILDTDRIYTPVCLLIRHGYDP